MSLTMSASEGRRACRSGRATSVLNPIEASAAHCGRASDAVSTGVTTRGLARE